VNPQRARFDLIMAKPSKSRGKSLDGGRRGIRKYPGLVTLQQARRD
jgi:hypothetical protein